MTSHGCMANCRSYVRKCCGNHPEERNKRKSKRRTESQSLIQGGAKKKRKRQRNTRSLRRIHENKHENAALPGVSEESSSSSDLRTSHDQDQPPLHPYLRESIRRTFRARQRDLALNL